MKTRFRERGETEVTVIGVIVVGVLAAVGAAAQCSANASGENQAAAEGAAKQYAKELGIEYTGLTCAGTDSDGDGYVSCTIAKAGGALVGIECAGKLTMNKGCRIPKLRAATGESQ